MKTDRAQVIAAQQQMAERNTNELLDSLDIKGEVERAGKALDGAIRTWGVLEPLVNEFASFLAEEIRTAMLDAEATPVLRRDGKPTTWEAWSRETGVDLMTILEKLTKSLRGLAQVIDEIVRLKSFLAGGPDTRIELEDMSDGELINVLVEVAVARGLWRLIERRREEVIASRPTSIPSPAPVLPGPPTSDGGPA